MMTALDGLVRRMGMAEERKSQLGNISTGFSKTKKQREQRSKTRTRTGKNKTKQTIQRLWDTTKGVTYK